jgi:hypothetical protein
MRLDESVELRVAYASVHAHDEFLGRDPGGEVRGRGDGALVLGSLTRSSSFEWSPVAQVLTDLSDSHHFWFSHCFIGHGAPYFFFICPNSLRALSVR